MTRDDVAATIRENLDDAGVTFYSATDINDSIQDAYDDVAVITGCIQKSVDINFVSNLSYYDFKTLISDYFAAVALYNNVTKRWMDADSRKSFDYIRRDWELWVGAPAFWSPIDNRYAVIIPRLTSATGTFTVFYRATAPTLSGSDVPLIHSDSLNLLEYYGTADLLDQQQEYSKAEIWWEQYFENLLQYKSRIGKLAETDYLPQLELR